MKELLNFIIDSLLETKDFKIEEIEESGNITLKIVVPPPEIGQIIGKSGRTIKAIQDIVRVRARLEGKTVFIQIAES